MYIKCIFLIHHIIMIYFFLHIFLFYNKEQSPEIPQLILLQYREKDFKMPGGSRLEKNLSPNNTNSAGLQSMQGTVLEIEISSDQLF